MLSNSFWHASHIDVTCTNTRLGRRQKDCANELFSLMNVDFFLFIKMNTYYVAKIDQTGRSGFENQSV